ncbi:hypothetical protein [Collinsella stercoris]|uniref:hypothetical protein n=1 Tax=Collinsella stercoris TaxID=147206 RepID=UPI003993D9F1
MGDGTVLAKKEDDRRARGGHKPRKTTSQHCPRYRLHKTGIKLHMMYAFQREVFSSGSKYPHCASNIHPGANKTQGFAQAQRGGKAIKATATWMNTGLHAHYLGCCQSLVYA